MGKLPIEPDSDLMTIEAVTDSPDGPASIHGHVNPRYRAVAEVFLDSFARGADVGASVCFTLDGVTVVDLWGGWCDEARTRPWGENTICNAMSVTKGFTSVCLHLLVDRGMVDLDSPVARYWPEFGQQGKEGIPVRWLTDQRAGLPALAEDLYPGAIFDWSEMTEALARQAPLLPPGATAAYHIRTSGFLIGEIVRRVSGKSLGAFLRSEISEPYNIDFHIGLNDSEIARCAEFIAARKGTLLDRSTVDPNSLMARANLQMPDPMDYNSDECRRAEIPSTNGHGNARAVARLYAILANGGMIDGRRLISRETIDAARKEQHRQTEVVLGRTYRQASGFLLNTPGDFPIGPGPNAFGLHGMGGALGMCDPDARLSFGYIENKMHSVSGLGPRAQNLLEAFYDVA